jgi:hypothetical protein
MRLTTALCGLVALFTLGAGLDLPSGGSNDFSCDAALAMRYAFDDPLNPGLDSVSGLTAGVTGTVSIQDNAYAEFDAATGATVRMQPFTVAAGGNVTFSWWMKPDSVAKAQAWGERGVFQMGSNSAANQIRWRWKNSDATVWYPQIRNGGTWAMEAISGVQPDVWIFVVWRIRADGHWSVHIDDVEKFSGVKQAPALGIYDEIVHHIGQSNHNPTYPGGLSDFRVYHRYLSETDVEAVRAGAPLTECAEQTPPPGFKKRVTKIKATMSVPLTVEEFNEDAQLEYRETIAAVVGVAKEQVSILSVSAE